jgi:hypothetical protein
LFLPSRRGLMPPLPEVVVCPLPKEAPMTPFEEITLVMMALSVVVAAIALGALLA